MSNLKRYIGAMITMYVLVSTPQVLAADTIKVGVLHSLSGTMAISETTLKDTMLMLIKDQNKKGGVLGKKLEAVVVDPASNWPLFAEKARVATLDAAKMAGIEVISLINEPTAAA